MLDRLKREPAVVIGIVAAAALAVVQSLAGSGVVGQDVADTIGKALAPDGGWAVPIIVAIVTRYFVTSASAPTVKEGTEVTVVTPGNQPNATAVLTADAGKVVVTA